jgi:hypothetical protein
METPQASRDAGEGACYSPPTLAALAPPPPPRPLKARRKPPPPCLLLVLAAGTVVAAVAFSLNIDWIFGAADVEARCPRWLQHHAHAPMLAGPTGGLDARSARQHHDRRQRLLRAALKAADGVASDAPTRRSARELDRLHQLLVDGGCATELTVERERIDGARAALEPLRRAAHSTNATRSSRAHGDRKRVVHRFVSSPGAHNRTAARNASHLVNHTRLGVHGHSQDRKPSAATPQPGRLRIGAKQS